MTFPAHYWFITVFFFVGTIFSLTFFTKFLKLDDAVLGMISSTSKICACVVYALAPSSSVFYIGIFCFNLSKKIKTELQGLVSSS